MSLFDTPTQTRFLNEAEDQFNSETPNILDRLALDIVAAQPLYVLPDYVARIKRVTWLGYKVDAANHRELREADLIGTEAGGTRPYNYIFNNVGLLTIRFFPIPDVTIASITTNLWGSEIPNRVIVEFWRASDYSTFVSPPFFRDRLNFRYQQAKLNALEGRGQNLKASKYWLQQWQQWNERYSELLQYLEVGPRRTIFGHSSYNPTILYPHLPVSKFGIGVDPGE